MKKFTVFGSLPGHAYYVYDENGQLIGTLESLVIRISGKILKPIVELRKQDGSVEEGFIDNLSCSGTIVPK